MKILKSGIAACILLFLIYIYASPYITVYQMKESAENHDGASLSEHVDYPALRESLKSQMNTMLGVNRDVKSVKDIPMAAFGSLFGGILAEKMVDAYLTPESIAKLMNGEEQNSKNSQEYSKTHSSPKPFSDASMSYESFSRFSITLKENESDKEIKFILRRSGMEWKLTEILLPR